MRLSTLMILIFGVTVLLELVLVGTFREDDGLLDDELIFTAKYNTIRIYKTHNEKLLTMTTL